jgi:hypothetical protein
MAAREDPEFPDVLEHNISEEDMMIALRNYGYISVVTYIVIQKSQCSRQPDRRA